MDPLMHGLITREVPSRRGVHGVLPVVLAAGCVTCGAPRGETVYVLKATDHGSFGEPGWSNPCGHQDGHNGAVTESIALIGHLLRFPNAQIQVLAQMYLDIAADAYLPEPAVGRTYRRAGAR